MILIYLSMVHENQNLKPKMIKLLQKCYVWEILVMIGLLQMLKKTGLWGEISDFAVDYTSTNIGDIYNIHRYLMKKHNINT